MKKSLLLFILVAIVSSFSHKALAQNNADKKYELVQIDTKFGAVLIWLYDETPKHKANFLKLVKDGFYNGTTFHRIIPNFMVQGGDPNSKDNNPNNDGQGGPNYQIDAEFVPSLSHFYGAVAAARTGDNVNPQRKSSGSQFYIVQNKNGTPNLNQAYTVFGKVLTGMDVVDTIAKQAKGPGDRPLENITMQAKIITMTGKELKEKYNYILE